MSISSHQGGLIIVLSMLVALLLSIVPLPEALVLFRPQWVALVFIYWTLALPERVGVFTGFIIGLLLDVLQGTLLGQHALSLSLIGYITLFIHQRVRVFPLWQQSLFLLLLLLLDSMISRWVLGISDRPIDESRYWITPVIGAILWPWVYTILRDIRRRFRVR